MILSNAGHLRSSFSTGKLLPNRHTADIGALPGPGNIGPLPLRAPGSVLRTVHEAVSHRVSADRSAWREIVSPVLAAAADKTGKRCPRCRGDRRFASVKIGRPGNSESYKEEP